MANIKFSQFTVGNTESDIDFVVGYKGANNIQISPANLLSATLAGYLPLTGGTMTGNIKYNNGVRAQFGNSGNAEILFNGSNLLMSTFGGDMILTNYANDKDIVFQSDDGSGGVTTYFKLDGSSTDIQYFKDLLIADNVKVELGNAGDLKLQHNGTNNFIDSYTGNLNIRNHNADKDIIFQADDGSGGVTTYMFLDGSTTLVQFYKSTKHSDNIVANFGNSSDMQIYHSGTNGFINNNTGNLYITNYSDNEDIIFRSDDGAGGVATYFYLDGSLTTVTPRTVFPDDSVLGFGTGADLQIYHDGTTSNIANYTNNLSIINHFNDGDIKFFSDDGSGGVTEYFRVDGGENRIVYSQNSRHLDNVVSMYGSGADLQIKHDGSNSYISNNTGVLYIQQLTDDSDIVFQSDDGSGGVTEYFRVDGSSQINIFSKNVRLNDDVQLQIGGGSDLRLTHASASNSSFIQNFTGDLQIQNQANDKDILFRCDDGSGGITTYFYLDGSDTLTRFEKNARFNDSALLELGTSGDLQIFHNSTDSFIDNHTGNLTLRNRTNDGDIVFVCDDGSGGLAEYYRIDGSLTLNRFLKSTLYNDNIRASFGASSDLQIYHDSSSSYIKNNTGNLNIQEVGGGGIFFEKTDGENMAVFRTDAEVELYYNGVEKFATTSTGIKITGVSEYADNTAAIAGGLTTGDVYRTGDLLKIVH